MRTFTTGISDNSGGLGQAPRAGQIGNVYPAGRFLQPRLIPPNSRADGANAGKVRCYHS